MLRPMPDVVAEARRWRITATMRELTTVTAVAAKSAVRGASAVA